LRDTISLAIIILNKEYLGKFDFELDSADKQNVRIFFHDFVEGFATWIDSIRIFKEYSK
jgi:hypothetical protein